jgi:hypothetical protein
MGFAGRKSRSVDGLAGLAKMGQRKEDRRLFEESLELNGVEGVGLHPHFRKLLKIKHRNTARCDLFLMKV